MTKPKAKQPLSAFDPRLLQLLLFGARKRITIPFLGEGGKSLAHTFHRRLHTLRARMRQDNHEHAELSSRAYVRILWGSKAVKEGLLGKFDPGAIVKPEEYAALVNWKNDEAGHLGAFIIIQPRDSEFDSILSSLSELSTKAKELADDLPVLPPPPSSDEERELNEWLNTLNPDTPTEGQK